MEFGEKWSLAMLPHLLSRETSIYASLAKVVAPACLHEFWSNLYGILVSSNGSELKDKLMKEDHMRFVHHFDGVNCIRGLQSTDLYVPLLTGM